MSLCGDYDPGNVLAKIVRGELPAAVVADTPDTLAIMDLYPQTRGHCLVVPKAASRNLLEMDADALGPLVLEVQRVAKAVVAALQPDGVMVGQFNGAPAGQTIFHTHIHIIPRYEGQSMAGHGHAAKADPAELEKTAAAIRAHL